MHIIKEGSAGKYYKILTAITDLKSKMIEEEKEKDKLKFAEKEKELGIEFLNDDEKAKVEDDPQAKIKAAIKEAQINCLIAYITGKSEKVIIIVDFIK